MSKEIVLNVQEPYRSFIINGEKTVEGRIHKGKFLDIEVGDIFIFENEGLKFKIIEKNFI